MTEPGSAFKDREERGCGKAESEGGKERRTFSHFKRISFGREIGARPECAAEGNVSG